MKRGYIKLWRKIQDHPLHPLNRRQRDWSGYEAMQDLIMMAHGGDMPRKVQKGGTIIEIKRGQFDITTRQLAVRWRWSIGKVWKFLLRLTEESFMTQTVNRWFTVITIENYEIFNPRNEQKMNGSRTEVERNVNTIEREVMRSNEINDNNGEVEKKLSKWFSEMEGVKNPGGLANFYLKKYPERIIKKALNNSNCTGRARFSSLCEEYSKKKVV